MTSLRSFRGDRRGNVIITFAFALLPLIGFVGAAVDYSRANAARTTMQTAIDSTALMLSKEAQSLSTSQLQARASAIFAALYTRSDTKGIVVTPTLTKPSTGSFQLQMTGQGTIDTAFFGALRIVGLGRDTVTFNVTSQVLWGMKKLELALALDNTGSMASSSKMTELKKAAKSLIDTFQAASQTAGDIKIAIIPFATDVNIGKSNVSANWIDWSDWNDANGNCTNYRNWSGWSSPSTKSQCQNYSGTWTADSRSTWNGCVQDRDKDYDVKNTGATASIGGTMYPAHQDSNCPVQMTTLGSDWAAMKTKIDSMQPDGNTNVTIGLQLAFQTLTNAPPFNASAPASDLDKVIILLTDGENTQNRWDTSASAINARTTMACNNVKAANIKLYTVRVIDGNSTLLRACATKTDMFYDVDTASELNAVFSAIAKNLANLRIAK